VNLGLAYLGINRPADAEKAFRSVLEDDPENAEALRGLQEATQAVPPK
jgi:Tfp pilus assembly protein PilF